MLVFYLAIPRDRYPCQKSVAVVVE